jgi:hypothetical protein
MPGDYLWRETPPLRVVAGDGVGLTNAAEHRQIVTGLNNTEPPGRAGERHVKVVQPAR